MVEVVRVRVQRRRRRGVSSQEFYKDSEEE
jgi:hypothetical protein